MAPSPAAAPVARPAFPEPPPPRALIPPSFVRQAPRLPRMPSGMVCRRRGCAYALSDCSSRVRCSSSASPPAFATIFGSVRGVVHDPQHRPVPGATVVLKARDSEWNRDRRHRRERGIPVRRRAGRRLHGHRVARRLRHGAAGPHRRLRIDAGAARAARGRLRQAVGDGVGEPGGDRGRLGDADDARRARRHRADAGRRPDQQPAAR